MGIATAAIGAGTALAGSIGSFTQAARQRREMNEAQKAADKAIAEARKRLEVNQYETLGIQKLAYEQARDQAQISAADALTRAQESDPRALAGTAGLVQQANIQAQQGIRSAQEQEMLALDKLVAGEESRLADMGYNLDIRQAEGAQAAAANAYEAQQQAIGQGLSGLTSAALTAATIPALYGKGDARRLGRIGERMGGQEGLDYAVKGMLTPEQYTEYGNAPNKDAYLLSVLSGDQLKSLTQMSRQYGQDIYNLSQYNPAVPAPYNSPAYTGGFTGYRGMH